MIEGNDLTPHGFCLLWEPGLIWLHTLSDAVIALAYFSIPVALIVFVLRRRDLGFSWIFVLFAVFILACGTTHLLDIATLWWPGYWVQGVVKAVTAIVSLATAVLLWPLIPRALAIPSISSLRQANASLVGEIEERRRAESALAAERRRLAAVLEQMPFGVVVATAPEGTFEFINSAAQQLLGTEDMRAAGVADYAKFGAEHEDGRRFEPEDYPLSRALLRGERVLREQQSYRRSDGTIVHLEVSAAPVRDDRGETALGVVAFQDVSARVQSEEMLRRSQKMEAIGQLTSGVAHDFNNLLTIIMGGVERLQRILPEGSSERRSADIAMSGALRAAALTARLLAFSRRRPTRPEPVEVNGMVIGMIEMLRRTLGERVTIETRLAPDLWRASGDEPQFESALLNLAINARDAMPSGGRLLIGTRNCRLAAEDVQMRANLAPGDYVVLTVDDTGTGMTPDTMARAFDPFFTTKETGEGTGLGLAQVYRFAKQMGGHAEIESAVGRGTSVRIYLPRFETGEALAPHRADGVALSTTAADDRTVLVVEDDEDVRSSCVEMLRELGYRVVAAADDVAALELIAADPDIHLMLIDIGLPGARDGRQLAAEAACRHPAMRFIFTSGYAAEPTADIELLVKPFNLERLGRAVAAVLARRT
jgi:PAS domain S-box-containing protein